MILSSGQSKGILTSPYYPNHFPTNVTCRYFLEGLFNKQDVENVQVHILDFNLGSPPDDSAPLGFVLCAKSFLLSAVKRNFNIFFTLI